MNLIPMGGEANAGTVEMLWSGHGDTGWIRLGDKVKHSSARISSAV
jgi:hypothetical protein